jgi:hypothetical protein
LISIQPQAFSGQLFLCRELKAEGFLWNGLDDTPHALSRA